MRNVLVVTYHFLPVHNVAVRQFVGYCRYLPEFGWRPIVLTTDWPAGELDPRDAGWGLSHAPELEPTLGDVEVARAPRAWHDTVFTRAHRRLRAWTGDGAGQLARATLTPVRQAATQLVPLFGDYPDAFVGWTGPAAALGTRLCRERDVAAIVSNCPPASNHVVGSRVAEATGTPWFPYFGDLFAFDVGPHSLLRTALQRGLARRRNASWLRHASATFAVSPGLVRYLEDTYGVPGEVVVVGFDPHDFSGATPPRGDRLRLAHVGSIYPDQRPELFLDALDAFLTKRPEAAGQLSVRLVGSKREAELRDRLQGRRCAAVVAVEGKVSPAEALATQLESHALLLFPFMGAWNRTRYGAFSYPSKIFEYFGARRPILSVPSDGGWVDQLLADTGAGRGAATVDDAAAILGRWFEDWQTTGMVRWEGRPDVIERFTHREQARVMAAQMDAASARTRGSRASA